jgi:hypothetical protein
LRYMLRYELKSFNLTCRSWKYHGKGQESFITEISTSGLLSAVTISFATRCPTPPQLRQQRPSTNSCSDAAKETSIQRIRYAPAAKLTGERRRHGNAKMNVKRQTGLNIEPIASG